MKKVSIGLLVGVVAACGWETVTASLKLAGVQHSPTISSGVDHYWWLGPPILVGLGIHLYWRHVVRLVAWIRKPFTK